MQQRVLCTTNPEKRGPFDAVIPLPCLSSRELRRVIAKDARGKRAWTPDKKLTSTFVYNAALPH